MTLSTVDVIWSTLEAKHPHVSLTPLAAFFSLAALHHDAPLGYHTPPPLPPMVHHCRVPQQFAHAAVTAFCVAHSDGEAVDKTTAEAVPVEGLHVYTVLAHASSADACGMGVLLIRKLLAVEAEAPAVAVVQTGVVPRLIEIANDASMPTAFVFQSLWALTNVLASDDPVCKAVIPEVLPTFVKHAATTKSSDVGEQAAWGIGNAAGDSTAVRDYVLQLDSVPALLSLVDRVSNLQLARNAVWAMSNLCRGKPAPALELVQPLIPKLHLLLQHSDSEVVADAAWAMSYISDGPEERIRAILPAVEDIVALLALPETSVTLPAVRTVGNIVTGTDQVTQKVLDAGCLPHFHSLLAHPRRGVRKEACWALSNITAGSSHQIQQVIDAVLIPPLLNIVQHGADFDVVKEAVWAISNSTCGGLPVQLQFLVDNGVCPALTSRLQQTTDVKLIVVLLEAVENLLSTLNDTPDCRRQFQDCGGVALLHTFSNSHVVEISSVANALLETYFDEGEGAAQQDADADEHAAQRSSHAAFQF